MVAFFVSAAQACVEEFTDAPVIMITPFKRNYHGIHTGKTAEELNEGKYSEEILDSAVIGARDGWDRPGARTAREIAQQALRAEESKKLALEAENAQRLIEDIASTYAGSVKETVSSEEWSAIPGRNRFYGRNRCASNDFCDANALLLDAMRRHGFACIRERDVDIWRPVRDAAWKFARSRFFSRQPKPLTQPMIRELRSIALNGNPTDPADGNHSPEGVWFHARERMLGRLLGRGLICGGRGYRLTGAGEDALKELKDHDRDPH
jgi:hypothetical protein